MINNPFAEEGIIACQYCGSGEYLYNEDGNRNSYCGQFGTRIDWPEDDKDGWKSTNTSLPKYGVPCKTKYKDGREYTAVFSSWGWHSEGVFSAIKEPDYWRYFSEDNDEESNT